ncbi:MAG: lamin tail domain-containing protein, partial [Verrucomicrobiota bacterium]
VPACLSRWQNYTNRLYTAMIAESARWGDYKRDTTGETTLYTRDDHWIPESVRLVEHYFPARSAEVLADWRTAQWYPDVEAPAFNQHGGGVQHGFNLIIDPGNAGTLWYTVDGSDPRLEGGNVDPHARSGPLGTNLLYTTTVRARMRDGPDWSALNAATFFLPATNIVVSEIMYNPPNPLHAFIELKNGGSHPLVLDGVRFTQGIRFDFNASSIPNLAPGMYLLVVRDRAAFETRYGTQLPVAGCFTGKFDKGGEQLVLVDGQGNTIVDFTWNDSRSWPTTPDGAGHSLVPLEPRDALLDFGGNWRSSAFIGGSPGEADPEPITDLVLNEILAHTDFSDPGFPDYDSNDGIEIYHAGPGALSLTNWYLSDDRNNLMKWGIPGTNTITGPGWIHFNEVGDFHNPTNSGFGLDKTGEEVLLSYLPASGPGRVADAIRFKGEEKNVALGRYPDGAQAWYHLVPTPGSANGLPPQPPLVISEIMYHPPPTPSHPADNTFHEFIELYNPGAQTVSLETDAGPWRIDGGVSFTFPAGTSVSAGEYLLLVQFSPMNTSERTSFLNHYTLDPATWVYGPYSGKLSNRGERIAIEKPQEADQPGDDPSWVIVDEVFYYDNAPYATTADGQGYSLHRLLPDQPGEQAENWISLPPFPATPAEQVTLSQTIGGKISWSAQTGVTYILEFKDQLDETTWQAMDTPLGSGPIQLIDPGASTQPFRVYRIRAIP